MSDGELAQPSGDERRDYFRVNDAVALHVEPIDAADLPALQARFDDERLRFGLGNYLAHCNEQLLPQRKRLESRYPEVAEYLQALEQRLDMLASLLASDVGLEDEPSHVANISGSGIDFAYHRPLAEGEHALLRVVLFPEQARILAIGRVMHAGHYEDSQPAGGRDGVGQAQQFRAGMHFEHIHEADRERLIKHIHGLQMQSLRARRD